MHELTTVYRKYVTKMTNLSNPPLLEMSEIALPTPLKIDAPECVFSTVCWRLQGVMPEKTQCIPQPNPDSSWIDVKMCVLSPVLKGCWDYVRYQMNVWYWRMQVYRKSAEDIFCCVKRFVLFPLPTILRAYSGAKKPSPQSPEKFFKSFRLFMSNVSYKFCHQWYACTWLRVLLERWLYCLTTELSSKAID